jgi:hypothetical protein
MGRARLSCAGGCACAPAEVDAHHKERTSVAATAVLPVWPAPGGDASSNSLESSSSSGGGAAAAAEQLRRCVVRVEVLRGTSSGEHKFKLLQVVTRAKDAFAAA